jgi:hypothetical protein
MTTFVEKWRIIKIKADLLCMGIRPNELVERIYSRQNPSGDWKTGNVGLHLQFEDGSHVLVTVVHKFDSKSPYSLENGNSGLVLKKGEEFASHVREVEMPHWYEKTTTTSTPMSAIFLHEGSAFLHQAYAGCDYHAVQMQCKFCGTGSKWCIGTPKEVADVVVQAVKENKNYHVCLGGGTRLPLQRNVEYFNECLTEIRKNNSEVPSWIEMVPPKSDAELAMLVESGATSFGFNIEIWDDDLRREICPGKSRIGKKRYLAALKAAKHLLGENRTGSCLLVGLEPINSSIKGAMELASIGVQPCMLPFKPWDKSFYKDRYPCNPADLIEVSKSAVKAMIDNGIAPDKNEGCLLCEGCTIDHDIYNIFGLEAKQKEK